MPPSDLLVRIEILGPDGSVLEERNATTYRMLLEAAHNAGLKELTTELVTVPSPISNDLAIVRATVTLARGTFTGIGDASTENVAEKLARALPRVAETRAVCRALRAALCVPFVAVEEMAEKIRFVQTRKEAGPKDATSDGRESSPANGFSTPRPPHRFGRADERPPSTPSTSASRQPDERRSLSDDQKRLVFRLCYELGASRENVRERVLEALGVERLEHATKTDATRAIENLKRRLSSEKNGSGRGHQNGAAPHVG